MILRKVTNEQFEEAAKASFSWREVCKKLSIFYSHQAIVRFRRFSLERNIDVSHFLGQAIWKDRRKTHPSRKLATELTGVNSHHRKIALIRDGFKKKACEICERAEWNHQLIPLELHHIDGNRNNNQLDNLQILCPNCHAQTPNYGTRNRQRSPKEEASDSESE